MTSRELEDRLIKFSIDIILLSVDHDQVFAKEHLSKQLIRSATSVALNYGEAQGSSSSRDFIHKMRICLKELRESLVNLKIQQGAFLIKDDQNLLKAIDENNQLISIFVTSIRTAEKNLKS